MSGVEERATQAVATLRCKKCGKTWESKRYSPNRWGDDVRAAAPAFLLGWRVFVGGRSQHAYCPKHGPSATMRQLHPEPSRG